MLSIENLTLHYGHSQILHGITMDAAVPMTTQERAYTSAIWYTP